MRINNFKNEIKEITLSEVKNIKVIDGEKIVLVRKIYDKGMGSYMNLNPFADTHMQIFNAWFPINKYIIKYKIKNSDIFLISISDDLCEDKDLTDIREYVDVILYYLREKRNKILNPIY